MQEAAIWIESTGARARYAVEQMLGTMLGFRIQRVSDRRDLDPAALPCLCYSYDPVPGAFHVRPADGLQDGSPPTIDPGVSHRGDQPMLFPVEGGDLPFDPFAAAFFLLSRAEEWTSLPADEHGRPLTNALHAARHDYLHRPVVDEWALLLAEAWRARDPRLPIPRRSYQQVTTIDLDNGFKYLGREPWRSAGAWVREQLTGDRRSARERIAVLSGKAADPFELDDEVLDRLSRCSSRTIAFVLTSDRGKHDHAVPVEHPRYAAYLRRISAHAEIGLHPSYRTSTVQGLTEIERDRLANAVERPISASRQHFLRFATPGTFRTAIALGFSEEHSMGCHDRLGFRAGTCTPYKWYDLERDESTELTIHPFAAMDNTLSEKLRLTPENALHETERVIAAVKRVSGTFTGLWHESFLAATGAKASWRPAILRIIGNAAP